MAAYHMIRYDAMQKVAIFSLTCAASLTIVIKAACNVENGKCEL